MYDFVIVGAGSAGCVLAARLSENPNCQVLLLEAGPPDKKLEIHIPAAFNKLFTTKYDWAYETEPQANLDGRVMFWPRGKTLGGSSSLNAQMRGNALDYDHWADLGNKGWAYGDVLPYFERSERSERGTAPRRGTSGPLNIADLRDPNPTTIAFLEAAEQAGADQLTELGIPVVVDLPGVGKNLQDHLAIMDIVHSKEPVTLAAAQSLPNLARFLTRGRGMLTSNVGEACGFARTRPELDAPDLELIFAPVPFIDHGLAPPPGHGITIGSVGVTPRSVGELTLRSADPLAAPRIEPNYLSDPDCEDLRVLVEGSKIARQIFDAPALARYAGDPLLPAVRPATDDELVEHVRRNSQTLYHPVGTCKMGTDDLAVVDPELRVRGVENLRVVDASVMPVIPRGHTHASTVMIAEKAVDLIRD
jgi:choline dehydrogenase-like flavoprotein